MVTATGGSTTTIIDSNNLQYVDSYWNEQTVLFTSGTNNGLQRKISAYTSATSQATLYSAATAAVVSGDTAELYRRFSPTDIKTALNAAINKSWPHFYEKVVAVATPIHDTLQYTFPTGPDMGDKGLVAVQYQVHTLAAQSTWPYQTLVNGEDYEVVEDYSTAANYSVKTLQLKFNPESNRLLRLIFGGPLTPVSADADLIRLGTPDVEWLYAKSIEELWRLEAARSESVARKDAQQERSAWAAEADSLQKSLGHQWPQAPLKRTRFHVIRV
jgi:hypothetical protein